MNDKTEPLNSFWSRQNSRIALLYTVFLSAMLFTPLPKMDALSQGSHVDKVVHVFLFAMFAAIWARALGYHARPYVETIGLSILFSVSTELVQSILPWRTGDVMDLIFNFVGVAGGVAVVRMLNLARSPTD